MVWLTTIQKIGIMQKGYKTASGNQAFNEEEYYKNMAADIVTKPQAVIQTFSLGRKEKQKR